MSVRLSVTSRCCMKTTKPRITQTTPYDSAVTLVYKQAIHSCSVYIRNETEIVKNCDFFIKDKNSSEHMEELWRHLSHVLYIVKENSLNKWHYACDLVNAIFPKPRRGRGSKLTGWSKARQQMLKLWGLSWLTPNHHSGFYVAYPLTISTKARPRQWGRERGEAEAVFLRPRQANEIPRPMAWPHEAEASQFSASRQPRGEASASRTTSLHYALCNFVCVLYMMLKLFTW